MTLGLPCERSRPETRPLAQDDPNTATDPVHVHAAKQSDVGSGSFTDTSGSAAVHPVDRGTGTNHAHEGPKRTDEPAGAISAYETVAEPLAFVIRCRRARLCRPS
jgi:hypothetical protein